MHQKHLIWPYKLIYLFGQKLKGVGIFYEHPYMWAHKAEITLLTYFCKIRYHFFYNPCSQFVSYEIPKIYIAQKTLLNYKPQQLAKREPESRLRRTIVGVCKGENDNIVSHFFHISKGAVRINHNLTSNFEKRKSWQH